MAPENRVIGIIGGRRYSGAERGAVQRRREHPLLYMHLYRDKIRLFQGDVCMQKHVKASFMAETRPVKIYK